MRARNATGQAVGLVIAVAVIVLIFVVGTYFIMRMYSATFLALERYGTYVQKPIIRVSYVAASQGSLEFMLKELEGGPTQVEAIYVVGPSQASQVYGGGATLTASTPVTFTVPLTNPIVQHDIQNEMPITFAVVTSHGVYTLSTPALNATVVVNALVPTWFVTLNANRPGAVTIGYYCGGGVATVVPSVSFFPSGNYYYTYYAVVSVPAFTQCTFYAKLSGEYYVLGPSGGQLSGQEQQLYGATEFQELEQNSTLVLAPGQSQVVSFRFPMVLASQVQGQYINTPHLHGTPFEVDFSWLYDPYLYTQNYMGLGRAYAEYPSEPIVEATYQLEQQLVTEGAVWAGSPACQFAPNPLPQQPNVNYFVNFTYYEYDMFMGASVHPNLAWPTGFIEAFYDCGNVNSGEEVGQVTVPVVVPQGGTYLVVPVIGIFVPKQGSNGNWPELPAVVSVAIYGPSGQPPALTNKSFQITLGPTVYLVQYGGYFAMAYTFPGGVELAPALAQVNLSQGETIYVVVSISAAKSGTPPNFGIIVSKVVFIPYDPSQPSLLLQSPWSYVNMASNTTSSTALALINLWPAPTGGPSSLVLTNKTVFKSLVVEPGCQLATSTPAGPSPISGLALFGDCYDGGPYIQVDSFADSPSLSADFLVVPYLGPGAPDSAWVASALGSLSNNSALQLALGQEPSMLGAYSGDGDAYISVSINGLSFGDWVLVPVEVFGDSAPPSNNTPIASPSMSYGGPVTVLGSFTYKLSGGGGYWYGEVLALYVMQQTATLTIRVPVNGTAYVDVMGIAVLKPVVYNTTGIYGAGAYVELPAPANRSLQLALVGESGVLLSVPVAKGQQGVFIPLQYIVESVGTDYSELFSQEPLVVELTNATSK